MREHDARLIPGALACVITSVLASRTQQWTLALGLWLALACCALGAAVALTRAAAGPVSATRTGNVRRARDATWVAVLTCGVVAAVCASAVMHGHRAVPAPLGGTDHAGRHATVHGTVTSEAKQAGEDAFTRSKRQSLTLHVTWVCGAPCATPQRADATVTAYLGDGWAPGIGDVVDATGVAGPSRDPRVDASLWDATATVVGRDAALAWVAAIRDRAQALAAELPAGSRALTVGMVTGDTRGMPQALTNDMRRTSLTHLTAVSGSHFAVVAMVLGALLRRTVRWRITRAVVLGASMIALAMIVLPQPSVVRALTMAVAVALGLAWGRPARAITALAAGTIVLLLIQPGLGAALGFQLSAMAVLAIVLWAPLLAHRLGRWLLPWLAKAVSVPLAAWLAGWPLIVAVNPGIGPYAVPANVCAGLFAAPVTVLGLTAVVASYLWWPAGQALMDVAGWCGEAVAWWARLFAHAPGAWHAWPQGAGGVLLACGVSTLALLATVARMPSAARLGALVAIAAVFCSSPWWSVGVRAALHDWDIVVCDVGQGTMVMVNESDHAAAVIDTGPPGGAGRQCLERYGVTRIDLLVLTHPHADHDGAVGEFLDVVSIGQIWAPPSAWEQGRDDAVRIARAASIPTVTPQQGQTWSGGQASVTALLVSGDTTATSDGQVNDTSLALWLSSSGTTALALGDLETAGQERLADVLGGPVVADMVIVAHHGSRTQSARLASLITARVAAVSVGEGNPYGHPSPQTVELYSASALLVASTEDCGDIAVNGDTVGARCRSPVAG